MSTGLRDLLDALQRQQDLSSDPRTEEQKIWDARVQHRLEAMHADLQRRGIQRLEVIEMAANFILQELMPLYRYAASEGADPEVFIKKVETAYENYPEPYALGCGMAELHMMGSRHETLSQSICRMMVMKQVEKEFGVRPGETTPLN